MHGNGVDGSTPNARCHKVATLSPMLADPTSRRNPLPKEENLEGRDRRSNAVI
jgi:hypothetical protein